MSVAIISYDTKFVENLIESLKDIKYEVFGDSLAFIKGFNDSINTVVYDASSGVFAEDDLRYLINKMKDKNLRYYVLTVPENPIDIGSFDGNVKFFNKKNDIEKLIEEINNLKTSLPKVEPVNVEQSFFDYEPQEIQFTESKKEENQTFDIEFNDLNLDLDYSLEEIKHSMQKEEKLEDILDFGHQEIKDLDSLIEHFESQYIEKEIVSSKDSHVEDFEKSLKDAGVKEEIMETKEPIMKKVSIEEIVKGENINDETIKEDGGKSMVANFNIQISSEDIKQIVLNVARDYIKNDPSINTIIDHLQIDFQAETMKELENIKNQLKEKAREEAEKVLKEEITNLIKNELKEYVAEITAKIVKEKLEQAFKAF